MDWDAAIEKNREALKRVLASLVAMAGAAAFTSPLRGGRWSPDHRVGVIVGTQPPPDASRRPPLKGEVKAEFTLPRHLHRAVCKLLRPAEAAVRRLIIVAARGLVVALTPPRKPRPKRVALEPLLRGLGIAVTMSPADLVEAAAAAKRAAAERAARPRTLSLPLTDPLRMFRPWRPIARSVPRILRLDRPFRPLPTPPSPDDPVSAVRLALRLEALGRALDDLPGQARRFARWRARAVAALAQSNERYAAAAQNKKTRRRFHRIWPLRPGRPPGGQRRPHHEVHDILDIVHGLAFWALERPNTS